MTYTSWIGGAEEVGRYSLLARSHRRHYDLEFFLCSLCKFLYADEVVLLSLVSEYVVECLAISENNLGPEVLVRVVIECHDMLGAVVRVKRFGHFLAHLVDHVLLYFRKCASQDQSSDVGSCEALSDRLCSTRERLTASLCSSHQAEYSVGSRKFVLDFLEVFQVIHQPDHSCGYRRFGSR